MSSTDHTRPFVVALGIAIGILTFSVLGFALMNGGLDFRSRAATIPKYTCMRDADHECPVAGGTLVGAVYCVGGCALPRKCCKTTIVAVNTPTPKASTPTKTPTPKASTPTKTPTPTVTKTGAWGKCSADANCANGLYCGATSQCTAQVSKCPRCSTVFAPDADPCSCSPTCRDLRCSGAQ
jgi:hypothetical protein